MTIMGLEQGLHADPKYPGAALGGPPCECAGVKTIGRCLGHASGSVAWPPRNGRKEAAELWRAAELDMLPGDLTRRAGIVTRMWPCRDGHGIHCDIIWPKHVESDRSATRARHLYEWTSRAMEYHGHTEPPLGLRCARCRRPAAIHKCPDVPCLGEGRNRPHRQGEVPEPLHRYGRLGRSQGPGLCQTLLRFLGWRRHLSRAGHGHSAGRMELEEWVKAGRSRPGRSQSVAWGMGNGRRGGEMEGRSGDSLLQQVKRAHTPVM
jgi:hypothetical protein